MQYLRLVIAITISSIILFLPGITEAQGLFGGVAGEELPDIVFKVIPSHIEISPGGNGVIAVILDIPGDYHIQDDLVVEFNNAEGIIPGELLKPEGIFDEFVKVIFYYDTPHFAVPFKVSEDAITGVRDVEAVIHYSPCTDFLCLGRFDETVKFRITIGDSVVPNPAFAEIEAEVPISEKSGTRRTATYEAAGAEAALASKIAGAIEKGSFIAYFLIFIGGILTSFTPCVYPMIPITVSYFGSRSSGSLRKGFLMSLLYVLGIVITYSTLGAIAGATGSAFASLSENRIIIGLIVVILVLLAASMFGAFELQMPSFIRNRLAKSPRKGILGPFFLGLVLGFVAAPCLGPIILAFLPFIALKGSIWFGFWLMFSYALGLGVLFIILGTFSGAIKRLPRSGEWLLTVKSVFGWIMLGVALFYARPLIPSMLYGYIIAIGLITFGAFAGAFTRMCEAPTPWENIKKVIAVIAVTAGIYGLVANMRATGVFLPEGAMDSRMQSAGSIEWVTSFDRALARAEAEKKPVLLDVYAENCPECVRMDRQTYSNPEVIRASGDFIPAKIHFADLRNVREKYGIMGFPATLFLKPDGEQIGKTIHGFIPSNAFLELMDEAKQVYGSGSGR